MNENTIWKNRKATLAVLAALSIAAPAFAAWSPLGFGFFATGDSDSPAFPQQDDSVYGMNFSIFLGSLNEMYGLCVAGVVMLTENVAGIEIAGLCNYSKKADDGVLQISGIFNFIDGYGDGVQIAGFLNGTQDFTGLQVGSINLSEGSNNGVQVGAINNGGAAKGDLCGLQIGALNAANELKGTQIGAVNLATMLHGVQIGAVNYVEQDFKGVQIGAINLVKSSDIAMLPILRVAF